MPMRIRFIWLTTLFFVFIFTACNRSLVKLDYTNAKDEVPQLGNLIFRFDKSLVNDSLINRWDSTEYISFEPKITGRFRWEHSDELVFSPDKPLLPATSYSAVLQDELLSHSKFGKIDSHSPIAFHTPNLQVTNSVASWVIQDETTNTAMPQLDIFFNYPVNPTALKEKLTIEYSGKPLTYNLQTLSADNKISIRFLDVKMEDKDLELKVSIDKGLFPEGGKNSNDQPTTFITVIGSPYSLRINELTSEHDGVNGIVKLNTSQPVSPINLTSFIKIEPAVKFTAEITNDGILIQSDKFDVDKTYSISVEKGLRGKIGGILHDSYEGNIAFGELEPSISFENSKGIYLSEKGEKNIEVKITNVPTVKITISKIYENNILASQHFGYEPDQNNSESNDGEDDRISYSNNSMFGDIVYQQDVDTKTLPRLGNSRIFHFNFPDNLPDFKGIYHIQIGSLKDYWVRDSRFISLSDIGLIAKEGKDKITVFANSISSASPLSNVSVMAYGQNNQLLGVGSTNTDGVAELALTRKDFAGFKPAMIIAKTAGDFNYLPFATARVNTSKFEVGGKRINSTGFDAFIYEERDIYRPGEKINYSVIIRDRSWHSPGDIPVKLKFLLPNGKELKTFRKNLNDQGSLEGSIELNTSAITGSYSLEVYTSNDVLLATQAFRIEEFVPDRIKVSATLDKDFLQPGEKSKLNIHAVNFFGPPASDRNYECEIQVKQKVFSPKKYAQYDFQLANQNSFFDKVERQGKTDDKGNASENYEVPELYKNLGLLQASFYATVFDETGRPVSRNVTANIYTQKTFFGIADDGYWYYPLNQVVHFPLIALDKNETTLNNVEAKVEVVKHEYRTVLSKSGNFFRYNSQEEDKLLITSTVKISGDNTIYNYTPNDPGEYELRVSLPGSSNYVTKHFYSYGSWGGDHSSFPVDNDGQIDISLDKSSYQTGESVKALFKTPFSGNMLITLETDHVVSYQYVNVQNRTASVDLKLTTEDMPNVYLTATLFKPHSISEIPLTVAHGFQNIKVEEADRKMTVEITAKKTVRSQTHQVVSIKAAPNSMVTLAAVDNGVLQISDFATPDPYDHFYSRRALDVDAYDIYPLLFPEIKGQLSSSGGDQDVDMKKRVNPMPAKRFKIMSYWSGIQKTNSSGETSFEFDIPAFSGEIRLMAVAYKDGQFGSNENTMTVADPIVLSSALPRFMSPKDSVTVPVTITNTTSHSTTAKAQITVSGNLQAVGNISQNITLGPNAETRVNFQVFAPPAIGAGKVKIEVRSMGELFVDETDLSIRPTAPLQKITGSGEIQGGQEQAIPLFQNDFISTSTDYSLKISRTPAVLLTKYLHELVVYPYGCTEQTVSTAFPQIYYGDMADQLRADKSSKATANYNIQEAIRKIKMRQLFNGGVTLWDNEDKENWWTTIYAAHFLIEAKKAGFDVDNGLLETMLTYINNSLKSRQTITYYYNRNQNKKIVPQEVIYGLYVLALGGKPNPGVMNYYKSNPELLALDCKYLLSAAYALAGDKRSYKEFLPTQFAGEESVPQTGGSFYSDIRDEALALDVLIDVDPTNAQIPVMAKHVTEKLSKRYWYSTQELSFGFLALGKIARNAAKSTATAEVSVDDKSIGSMNGTDLILNTKDLKGKKLVITAKGSGSLYYFWEAQGISASGIFKEEDNFLKVRKHFYDRFGRPIVGNSFKQNELVIVEITLQKTFDTEIDNVVITDMLPAGFEIENSRTKEIPGMDWIKNESAPTAMDVRDDRINLFVDAGSEVQRYYYAIRAVSPGTYIMGPVSADAMYKGEYHSYNGGGIIKVTF
jgi:alpha-2-macroglobulin